MGEDYTLGLTHSSREFLDDKDTRQEILTYTLIIGDILLFQENTAKKTVL